MFTKPPRGDNYEYLIQNCDAGVPRYDEATHYMYIPLVPGPNLPPLKQMIAELQDWVRQGHIQVLSVRRIKCFSSLGARRRIAPPTSCDPAMLPFFEKNAH